MRCSTRVVRSRKNLRQPKPACRKGSAGLNTDQNQEPMKRLLVVGWGRAGKDTAAMMLAAITKLPYAGSTSWAANEIVARVLGIHPQVAWETRHQNRQRWYEICNKIREGV